jgi:myosin heavy subunit
VLVSANPFKQLPLYGAEQVSLYSSSSAYDTPPHIYKLADDAYRRMVSEGSSQACIISGESGTCSYHTTYHTLALIRCCMCLFL